MPTLREMKKQLQAQIDAQLPPLMDVEAMRLEMLDWLAQFKAPESAGISSWEDAIRVSPTAEGDERLTSGVTIRLALPLYTRQNRYMVSVLESFARGSREVYIVTAHVNWKTDEWWRQKNVEQSYKGSFDDVLKARHTVWAQTFRAGELREALTACAIAILSHELVGVPPEKTGGEPVKHAFPMKLDVPEKE